MRKHWQTALAPPQAAAAEFSQYTKSADKGEQHSKQQESLKATGIHWIANLKLLPRVSQLLLQWLLFINTFQLRAKKLLQQVGLSIWEEGVELEITRFF